MANEHFILGEMQIKTIMRYLKHAFSECLRYKKLVEWKWSGGQKCYVLMLKTVKSQRNIIRTSSYPNSND